MKKIVITSLLQIFCLSSSYSQNPWSTPSYSLRDLVVYSGAGALSRHVEKDYFGGRYDYYLKSPFASVGFDYCFANSDALWGVGLFMSGSVGKKEYAGSGENVNKIWSNYLCAVKFTHHNKFLLTDKFDVCSGYIIGTRMKQYEQVNSGGEKMNAVSNRRFQLAAGISGTIKYYATDKLAIYAEAALGYNLDLFQVGIARRFKNI